MNHLRNVEEIAEIIQERWKVSDFEALQIAVKVQANQLYDDAHLASENVPSVFEKMAMELEELKDVISAIGED